MPRGVPRDPAARQYRANTVKVKLNDEEAAMIAAQARTTGISRPELLRRAFLAEAGDPVTEHALLMPSGEYRVWDTAPYMEKMYPLAERIEHARRDHGKVFRRRVIVVEDWTEVPGEPSQR